MKKNIPLILIFISQCSLTAQTASSIEQKLTGGNKKRWAFSETVHLMGMREKTDTTCVYRSITFSSDKKCFVVNCSDNKPVSTSFSISQSGTDEFYVLINGVHYEVLFEEKKEGDKTKSLLVLRKNVDKKLQESLEYTYNEG